MQGQAVGPRVYSFSHARVVATDLMRGLVRICSLGFRPTESHASDVQFSSPLRWVRGN